jgi:glucose-1-phosphate thymidylyltransferase
MRGIVLAGGRGTRLWPITQATNKQLLAVHDKPMIHYPIATLMTAGIKDILVVCNPNDLESFRRLLGTGAKLGINFEYVAQTQPGGIAEGLIVGENFIQNESVCLILGDNIFHGPGLGRGLEEFRDPKGATVFAYHVSNPSQYGVVEFNSKGAVLSIEEKPTSPKSNWAIPGMYFLDNSCIDRAKKTIRSKRNELEITSVLNSYLQDNLLNVSILPRGTAWLDTGTINDLNDAASYFRLLEDRQGTKVSCLEEVAWRLGLISSEELALLCREYVGSPYGQYLDSILDENYMRNW